MSIKQVLFFLRITRVLTQEILSCCKLSPKLCEQLMFAYLRATPGGWISTPCRAINRTSLFSLQVVDMMAWRHPRTEVSVLSLEQGCIPVIRDIKRWSSHNANG